MDVSVFLQPVTFNAQDVGVEYALLQGETLGCTGTEMGGGCVDMPLLFIKSERPY